MDHSIGDVQCLGMEDELLQCPHTNSTLSTCSDFDDASVVCQSMQFQVVKATEKLCNNNYVQPETSVQYTARIDGVHNLYSNGHVSKVYMTFPMEI